MIRPSDPGRWAELCAAFDTLVELDTGARAERLAQIGEADPEARTALEELLEGDSSAGDRLVAFDGIFRAADQDVLKLVGRTVAHFHIIEPLATGGMGVVYRAIDTRLARPVALKFPLPGQRLDGGVRERFLREARAAAALDHPNICSIYETGETEDGRLFLAMPLYQGETLKARLSRAGPLPIADAVSIAEQIARGLSSAHGTGIVHRDLKPANVMLLRSGEIKILDFGIARVGDTALTKSRDTLGTLAYMAPEQVRGERLDGRADLWSLGVLLYEMSTGRRPFEGEHEIAVAHAIVHSNPTRPSTVRPDIGPELEALIIGLLAREPARRSAAAEAVAAELAAIQAQREPSPKHQWRRAFTASRRRTLVRVAAFALVVVVVGATARLLPTGAARGPAEPRIVAVLPFENVGDREDTEYLTVSLADEIASRLSRLSAVTVPSDAGPGTGAVVRGAVQRIGNEVGLRIDVFDADRKDRVLSREYRGPADSVLALQRSATGAIVAALGLRVTPSERAVLTHIPTRSADGYDLYLRGRAAQIGAASHDSGQRFAGLQRAQSYYALARESDPGFAAPRVSLAMLHLALAGTDRTSARRDQARLEAEAALRLQPGMPEAHEALAAYWALLGNDLQAVTELERALAGRPNASHLYRLLGINLRQVGRWEEAVSALERGSRLDPLNKRVHTQAALTYARLRRYDESIAHWNRVIAIDSARDPFPQIVRGFNYLRRGDVDSLEAAIRRIPLGSDRGGMTTYARYTLHRIKGRNAEALASLDSARLVIIGDSLVYRPVSLLRAQTLERMGDLRGARSAYEAARVVLEDSVAANPRYPGIRIALGLAYAGLHRRADAMREALAATELVPVSANSSSATAFMGGAVEIYAQLGETDAALQLIELLLSMPAGREVSVPLLRLDPTFDPLRRDPRFAALIERFSRD
jgi:serine/threonine-protein kinase